MAVERQSRAWKASPEVSSGPENTAGRPRSQWPTTSTRDVWSADRTLARISDHSISRAVQIPSRFLSSNRCRETTPRCNSSASARDLREKPSKDRKW